MDSFRHLKGALRMVLVIFVILGFWYSRSQSSWKKYLKPTDATATHIKVSLNPNLSAYVDLFSQTNRVVRKILGNRTDDNLGVNVEERLKKRREQVQATCSLMKKENLKIDLAEKQFVFYKNVSTMYCPVPKVASKFWTRMLHVLNTDNYSSPFEIGNVRKLRLRDQVINMTLDQKKNYVQTVLNDSFSFIFARDPYKRIFATNVDKYLSPNNMYRQRAAKMIYNLRNRNNTCGNDLKFSELVKTLTFREPEGLDVHFKPVSILCDICNVKYNVFGKVETFKDDVYYILNLIPNAKKIIIKDFAQQNDIYYIIFHAERTFKMLDNLLKCDSHQDIYLRLWRQFQISGLIEKHYKFPLSPEESQRLNLSSLTNLLLDAYQRSTSGARSNSREAYLQAYREVPLEDLEKLRLKYMKDFMLFDYESRPKELFERHFMSKAGDDFNFFDIFSATS